MSKRTVTLTDGKGHQHPVNREDLEEVVRRYMATQYLLHDGEDPASVTSEQLDRVAQSFTPQEVSAVIRRLQETGDVTVSFQ
ncbi:hypothetical protein LQ938_09525 [Microbacterium sp. cx-55]|uniref:hypothetical protein n=1 Tax=Microbacterium sp. cx-55 TaxID=2875948 RepID=UPI001CBE29BB|nr:hypothetical protein [Microbacterium sp. cx-55]MBZ4485999.1 hypothetical protein [Microbacterium sp. cx-55]UGB34128.1 hypothetical protein LQ938_09525 [Microbacterium sp. cx-55]